MRCRITLFDYAFGQITFAIIVRILLRKLYIPLTLRKFNSLVRFRNTPSSRAKLTSIVSSKTIGIPQALLTPAKVCAASEASYKDPGLEIRETRFCLPSSYLNLAFLAQLKGRPFYSPFRVKSEIPEFRQLNYQIPI